MNQDQQDFESLRRLLALKRHETPPPGYFNNFSRQVLARIRDGEAEAGLTLSERLLSRMPWLVKWLQGVETGPAFAGSFAAALCMLLVFGAVIAQRPEPGLEAFLQPAAPAHEGNPLPMVAATAPMPTQPSGIMIDTNTNPMINFQSPSLELEQMPASAQFANFSIPSN